METNRELRESHVGSGDFVYCASPAWEQLPEGLRFRDVVGVAIDSRDRVHVFHRSEDPIVVFDHEGNFLRTWGKGRFVGPHGITIGPDDMLYLSDYEDHTVHKFTPDGEHIFTLGTSGRPCDTGIEGLDYRMIERAGPPFHRPTNVALTSDGDMVISDGYGNARVHKFSSDGEHLFSWGEPGSGPGQFQLPHGIGIDSAGRVFVADRENSRLQLFTLDGEFLAEWTDLVRPTQVFIDQNDNVFVTELGRRAGIFPWMEIDLTSSGGRISVFDRDGKLQTRWGGGENPCDPADFFAPHDICIDSRGSIYVGEVTYTAGGNRGFVPPECPSLRKFVKKN